MSVGFDGMGAAYFDGDSPEPREVSLHVAEGMLQIGMDDGTTLRWPVEEVRQLPDIAGKTGIVLRRASDPVARLFVNDKALLPHLPQLTRRAPPKGRGRLAAWAVAAVAAVGLQIFVLIPLLADNLAGFIPPEGERALGEATYGQIREALDDTGLNPLEVCEAPDGVAAFAVDYNRSASTWWCRCRCGPFVCQLGFPIIVGASGTQTVPAGIDLAVAAG